MHQLILKDTVKVAILTIAAKVGGGVKTIVVARYFGPRDDVDAYLAAFLIPAFLGDVLAGALTQALMPVLHDVRHQSGEREEQRLCSSVFAVSTAILAAVAIIAALASGPLLQLTAWGFGPEKLRLTQQLLFIMLPILPLSAANVTFRTMLYARERFAAGAATPILTPLASIAALIAFGHGWGIYALAAGSTVGVLLEALALALALASSGRLPSLRWLGWPAGGRRVWNQYLAVASSGMILSGSGVVDQVMAGMLGAGSISALNYGTRLTSVLLAAGPAALATTIFPRLSRLAASGDWSAFRKIIRDFALLSIVLTIPLTLSLMYFSEPVVRMLFERGRFTAGDSHLVAQVQACSLAQIPFAVLLMLSMRVVSSLKRNRLLFYLGAVSFAANVLLNWLLMQQLGVIGIALATSGVNVIGLAFLSMAMFRRNGGDSQRIQRHES